MSEPIRSLAIVSRDEAWARGVTREIELLGGPWRALHFTTQRAALDALRQATPTAVLIEPEPGSSTDVLTRHLTEHQPGVARLALLTRGRPQLSGPGGADAEVCRDDATRDVLAMAERAVRLNTLLLSPKLPAVVDRVKQLPASPTTYHELVAKAADPESSIADFAAIIERDPVLSAKVLQLINSAFFGLHRRVVSVQQAVGYLGVTLIKSLALSTQVFGAFSSSAVPGVSVDQLQSWSIQVARLAQRMLPDKARGEAAFTAALVQDIGQIVLAVAFGDAYAAVVQEAAIEGFPLADAEKATFGLAHPEVGAYLLRKWGIPFPIVEVAAFHHAPAWVEAGARDKLAAAHAADALLGIYACGDPEDRIDMQFLTRAGFGGDVEGWRAMARESAGR